jgi:ankyrin repeat protein
MKAKKYHMKKLFFLFMSLGGIFHQLSAMQQPATINSTIIANRFGTYARTYFEQYAMNTKQKDLLKEFDPSGSLLKNGKFSAELIAEMAGKYAERLSASFLEKGPRFEKSCLDGNITEVDRLLASVWPHCALLINIPLDIEYGATALHVAAKNGNVPLMSLLIAYGAAIESRTLSGFTPLHYATLTDNVSAISLLLDHGATLEGKSVLGATALNYALDENRRDKRNGVAAIKTLLAHGATYNSTDTDELEFICL